MPDTPYRRLSSGFGSLKSCARPRILVYKPQIELVANTDLLIDAQKLVPEHAYNRKLGR